MCLFVGDTFSVVDDEFRTKALKVRRVSDKDIIAQIAYELAEEIFKRSKRSVCPIWERRQKCF